LSCQRKKLVGNRHAVAPLYHLLAFADHLHEFDARQDCLRSAKQFEAEHRPGDTFFGTMILLSKPSAQICASLKYVNHGKQSVC
jgi:hypothetical protein